MPVHYLYGGSTASYAAYGQSDFVTVDPSEAWAEGTKVVTIYGSGTVLKFTATDSLYQVFSRILNINVIRTYLSLLCIFISFVFIPFIIYYIVPFYSISFPYTPLRYHFTKYLNSHQPFNILLSGTLYPSSEIRLFLLLFFLLFFLPFPCIRCNFHLVWAT